MATNATSNVIKNYVDINYPEKIKAYHLELKKQKESKIAKVSGVTFIEKGLMWQDTKSNVELKLNQLELKVYCRKLNLANRRDWKVPSYDEMISLIDYNKMTPAGISKIKNIIPVEYWTSSQSVIEKEKNWFIDFDYGLSNISSKLKRYNIRCVRNMSTKEGTY